MALIAPADRPRSVSCVTIVQTANGCDELLAVFPDFLRPLVRFDNLTRSREEPAPVSTHVRFMIPLNCGESLCIVGAPSTEQQDLINLNVVALDSQNQPATDLTANDFVVTDAGKPREIGYLRHIDRRLEQPQVLSPGEFSNRTGATIPHATVILLDLMNQRFESRSLAANQIVKCLEKIESADFLYLYILTVEGRIYPVRGVPNTEGARGDPGPQWTSHIRQIMDAAMCTVLQSRPVDQDVACRTELTYGALEPLAATVRAANHDGLARGLKLQHRPEIKLVTLSRPAWGAWIETGIRIPLGLHHRRAPRGACGCRSVHNAARGGVPLVQLRTRPRLHIANEQLKHPLGTGFP